MIQGMKPSAETHKKMVNFQIKCEQTQMDIKLQELKTKSKLQITDLTFFFIKYQSGTQIEAGNGAATDLNQMKAKEIRGHWRESKIQKTTERK